MANPFRGEVDIGGGAYRLVCDFNALCEIEAHFNDDIDEALTRIDAGHLTLQDQRAVVMALLRHAHPAISLFEAGHVIARYFADIQGGVRRAISLAMPEASPGKKPRARAAGSTSPKS